MGVFFYELFCNLIVRADILEGSYDFLQDGNESMHKTAMSAAFHVSRTRAPMPHGSSTLARFDASGTEICGKTG